MNNIGNIEGIRKYFVISEYYIVHLKFEFAENYVYWPYGVYPLNQPFSNAATNCFHE
jgi:hypothetical protein